MFKKIHPNSAESDLGFIVERTGRTKIQYTEKDHNAIIDVEPGVGLAVYKNSIKEWLPPFENEAISDKKKKEILQNVSEALKFLKINFFIE